jgi:hypothetical protein
MQLHRGVRRDAWIFCLDYGRLMGDPERLGICLEPTIVPLGPIFKF